MKEIPKAYNPNEYEDEIYKKWEQSGFFNPDNLKLKKGADYFSLCMPPPNVTGILHLGHALENAIMDTTIRYERMRGKKAVLIPGTDHAGIATQAKVEKILVEQGIRNPRAELGREKLLEKVREYAENSKATILRQIKKMGTSCDWSRLAYTFDEKRNRAVNMVFKKMYDDGLVYRGFRAVNWSTLGQSTLSDDEIIYVERKAKFYTFKYSKDFPITISTTRPETKLGDTAVAVNPKDERYKKYIGKEFDVDFAGVKLHLKIIGDRGVDIDFGTGALGVTPAHSLIDYEMAVKNNLPIVRVIGEDGKIISEVGVYAGLTTLEAREKIVENLRREGLLEKEEEVDQNVGTADRFGDVVEVLPKMQWFVDVNKKIPSRGKSLKDLMREAVTTGHNGDKEQKVRITPERFTKVYLQWIDNLRDWCISRQIWWGHRIPVYYRKQKIFNSQFSISNNGVASRQEIYVGEKSPGEGWEQDPDTLDTWFSSGLWTFSTLGWPLSAKATRGRPGPENDLANFHPTTWMQMAYEILFFWMARMILMSTYVLDEIPFKDVYIHGILRDKEGRKFSKSVGNGVDPIEVCKKYGTDALRLSLLSGVVPGNDMRFYEEKVEGARNFVNKLWNISRYILAKRESSANFVRISANKLKDKTLADKWILDKFSQVTKEATNDLENFNFSQAGDKLREFTWSDFADWYLEIAKIEGNKDEILLYILENLLILWHPFVPFVTEKIWESFSQELLMMEKWPEVKTESRKQKAEKSVDKDIKLIQDIIVAIRNLRAEYKIEPAKKLNVIISAGSKMEILEENAEIIKGLRTGVRELNIEKKIVKPKGWVELDAGVSIYIDLAGAVDIVKERERIQKEISETEKYAKSLESKLNNKEFVSKAPENIVSQEKEKLKQQVEKLANLEKQIKILE
jgi:valyl-tRNA synthetase